MSAHVEVKRVFGRTIEKAKVDLFTQWFCNNIQHLEEALNDEKPYNGEMTIDYQAKTSSYIVEVKTLNHGFAEMIKSQFSEMQFDDSAIIGDIKAV